MLGKDIGISHDGSLLKKIETEISVSLGQRLWKSKLCNVTIHSNITTMRQTDEKEFMSCRFSRLVM